MANDKTYDRHVNIWINGKEVKNSLSDIKKEMFNLTNETARARKGSDEYNQKAAELRRVKQIYKEHKADIDGTGGAWTKLKGIFTSAQGMIVAGIAGIAGAYNAVKGIINSTDALGDKFEVTLAGWKSGLDAVARAIATMDFKNFGKNIKEAIEEGRRYAESLDQIDDKSRALRIAEAEGKNELLKQREIQNDVRRSLEERNKAGLRAIEIEEELAELRKGIANQAFQNEIDNIVKISHLHVDEVYALVRQKQAMLDNIEAGKKYNEMVAERAALDAKAQGELGVMALSQQELDRYEELRAAINGASEDVKRYAFAAQNLPGAEKMNLLTEKIIENLNSEGSALENTLKIRTKNANIENQINKQESDAVADQIIKYNALQTSIKNVTTELESYFNVKNIKINSPDEEIKNRRAAQIENLDNQLAIDEEYGWALIEVEKQKNEILRRNEITAAEQTGADIHLINQKYAKMDMLLEEQKLQAKLSLAAGFFGNISAIFGKHTAVGKAAAIAETTINTYASATASYKALASIPVVGPVLGFAAAGAAIAAGLANVRRIVSVKEPKKNLWTGGFSGPGGKYEPKGIVHGGEWVANAEMVSSPQFGPMIQALENVRASGMAGYANGGGPGMSASGSGASPALIGSDPELKNLIRENVRVNKMLLAEGVKTNFTYNDVDNVRKGINKLETIEADVSL